MPLEPLEWLEGTTITIEGMETEMFMGIRREDMSNPVCDPDGRPVVSKVQSAKFTLW